MPDLTGLSGPLPLVIWVALWGIGGIWMALSAFRLHPREAAVTGFTIGLVVENIIANLLGRFVAVPLAFWAAAVLVFLAGAVFRFSSGWRSYLQIPVRPWQWIFLIGTVYLFTEINRGLAIFDDYAHLPTTSMLAAGDIPPHFSLNPSVSYGYHYFLMLFAAQVMRVAGMAAWTALDFARALSFGLAVLLAALWTRRITRSWLAGLFGGLAAAFGSGCRWVLLFLPGRVLHLFGQGVDLLGSGAASGKDLLTALASAWAVEGSGPIPFPFAFANGIYAPGVINQLGPNGVIEPALTFLLLLTFNRWQNWRAGVVSVFLIAAMGLLAEASLGMMLAGWAVVPLAYWVVNRRVSFTRSLSSWLAVLAAGSLLGMAQGGAWTDLITGFFTRLVHGAGGTSYQTIGFSIDWLPAVVSSHLGVLSLLNPIQLLLALIEIGPVLLALPLVIVWGWKAFRLGRWFEAAMVAAAILSLGMFFVRFSGSTGVRNTSRLYEFVNVCAVFAVPLIWLWVKHRSKRIKALASGVGAAAVLGGVVLFSIELVAAQRPVYSYFIYELDKKYFEQYWDRLAPGSMVFDPVPFRAPTLFGRGTKSSLTWYATMDEWDRLVEAPVPAHLREFGFDYVYLDKNYWESIELKYRRGLEDPCVKVIEEMSLPEQGFRLLLDIRECPVEIRADQETR